MYIHMYIDIYAYTHIMWIYDIYIYICILCKYPYKLQAHGSQSQGFGLHDVVSAPGAPKHEVARHHVGTGEPADYHMLL